MLTRCNVSLIIKGANNMMISRMNSTYENINTKQNSNDDSSNLQTKLIAEQRRLKAVDSDSNMNESEKSKEKLRIQQQIDDLNRKLKMEQMEKETGDNSKVVQEETGKRASGTEDNEEKKTEGAEAVKDNERKLSMSKEKDKAGAVEDKNAIKEAEEKKAAERQTEKEEKTKEEQDKKENKGISPQEVHKMLSADYELQRDRVLNNVSEKKEGTEGVLRAEIKSDTIQGTDTENKKEQLSEMRKQKPIQIEAMEDEKKDIIKKPNDGMKVVIKEDSFV